MATIARYVLHGILLPGATWVTELADVTAAANVELLTGYAGGAVTPSFRGAQGARPDVTFSTPQIKTILDQCTDGDGVSMADYNEANVDLYYRLATAFGSRGAITDAEHLVVRARRSMMIWTQLEAKQGQPASIQCRIIPTFDGTNIPIVGIGSQTIPANLNVAEQFTLGPVELQGSGAWIDGVQGWTFAQGLEPDVDASDGDIYASHAGLGRGDPILTIDTPDVGLWEEYGVTGVALTALAAHLRKRNVDLAANHADATECHIKLSATDDPCGFVHVVDSKGGVADKATLGLRCALRRSVVGTTHPLTVATASAIALTE